MFVTNPPAGPLSVKLLFVVSPIYENEAAAGIGVAVVDDALYILVLDAPLAIVKFARFI